MGRARVPLPIEIERKFLVRGTAWQAQAISSGRIRQGYLNQPGGTTVRVRRCDNCATLAIKSFKSALSRVELEYDIPTSHADYLLDSVCDRRPVVKTRHVIAVDGAEWVVDVFEGANDGLITAEIELAAPDQPVSLPDWVGTEVTADLRYSNSRLYRYPYTEWRIIPQAPSPTLALAGQERANAGIAR